MSWWAPVTEVGSWPAEQQQWRRLQATSDPEETPSQQPVWDSATWNSIHGSSSCSSRESTASSLQLTGGRRSDSQLVMKDSCRPTAERWQSTSDFPSGCSVLNFQHPIVPARFIKRRRDLHSVDVLMTEKSVQMTNLDCLKFFTF